MLEGELWIKCNVICFLCCVDGLELGLDSQVFKFFYLFLENCFVKEDFYFVFLRNQEFFFFIEYRVLILIQFEVKNIILLVQKLYLFEEYM